MGNIVRNSKPTITTVARIDCITAGLFAFSAKNPLKKSYLIKYTFYEATISGAFNGVRVMRVHRYRRKINKTKMFRAACLVDVVTGTLYRIKDGTCLTSPNLRITKVEKASDEALVKLYESKGIEAFSDDYGD